MGMPYLVQGHLQWELMVVQPLEHCYQITTDSATISLLLQVQTVKTQHKLSQQYPTLLQTKRINLLPLKLEPIHCSLIIQGKCMELTAQRYSGSLLVNYTYLPSNATTTVTVQSSPIPGSYRQFSTSIGLLGKPSIR